MAFPGTYNFNYYRGDTAEFVIQPKTSNGEAFDLTGYTANFTIATARGIGGTSATAVVNDVTNIITCTNVYDVQITNATPNPDVIFTLLTGTITVTNDITGSSA